MPAGALPLSLKHGSRSAARCSTKPKVLILDESSAALDLDSTERLFAKMRELRDAGSCGADRHASHRRNDPHQPIASRCCATDATSASWRRATSPRPTCSRLMAGRAETAGKAGRAPPTDARDESVVLKADAMKIWPRSREIDFRLHRGEILGVAGLDGQGQIRVRAHAGGRPARARLGADGRRRARRLSRRSTSSRTPRATASPMSPGDRKREGIFANLSIFENMLLPLYRAKSRGGKLALIDWTALTGSFEWEREKLSIRMGDRGDKITSLSGGNQQKVLIGRAFALSPNILILNDPARGVDIGAKTDLYAHLRDFAAAGKSVVYMSSEIEELVGFCSRVLVFRNGHVFEELAGDDINGDRILAAMFGQHAPRRTRDAATARVATPRRSRRARARDARASVAAGRGRRRGAARSQPFALRSPAFADGGVIPDRLCRGEQRFAAARLGGAAGGRAQLRAGGDRSRRAARNSAFPAPSRIGWSPTFPPTSPSLPEGASRDARAAARGARIRRATS